VIWWSKAISPVIHELWLTLYIEHVLAAAWLQVLHLPSAWLIENHCLMSRNIWKAAHEFCMKFSFPSRMLSWECPPICLFTGLCNLRLHIEIDSFVLSTYTHIWMVGP